MSAQQENIIRKNLIRWKARYTSGFTLYWSYGTREVTFSLIIGRGYKYSPMCLCVCQIIAAAIDWLFDILCHVSSFDIFGQEYWHMQRAGCGRKCQRPGVFICYWFLSRGCERRFVNILVKWNWIANCIMYHHSNLPSPKILWHTTLKKSHVDSSTFIYLVKCRIVCEPGAQIWVIGTKRLH